MSAISRQAYCQWASANVRMIRIWHTGSEGLYDSQLYDPEHPDKHPFFNWRGVYHADSEGHYDCRALKPTPYPIPYDST